MSMIGQYARLTPDELKRAIDDPEWAQDHIDSIQDALDDADVYEDDWDGSDEPPGRAKLYSTGKSWNLLEFLLGRASFPVNVIYGDHVLDPEQDWGYGPASYLTPDRVRYASNALAALPFSQLAPGVTVAELKAARIYPDVWDELDAVEWGGGYYERLTAFFGAAADSGDAILMWIS
ncbi:MAG TPA: YfbM family protein [Candidatus Limnocylindrales bacterium]